MHKHYLGVILLAGACAVPLSAQQQPAAKASAQTKQAPKKTTTRAASPAFNRALLQPATLLARAPEVFEAKFTTTKGDFVIRVTRAWAPRGADRFYNLVKNGFYNQATLFRVVKTPRPFVVQFGISAFPQVSAIWETAVIKDDPVKASNKRGMVTFATGGPNTRTTQVFISYGDNSFLDSKGFSPFGEVSQGMEVVEQFYSGYAEDVTEKQGQIAQQGNAYLNQQYPKLDRIVSAVIVPRAPATATPKAPAKPQPKS